MSSLQKSILNFETVNLNDKFNRAQWKFCPITLDEEIAKDIHMGIENKVNSILYLLLGWNKKDINYFKCTSEREPICYMFEKIKTRQMELCRILCNNPNLHFHEKKCYPICKVYQILKKIDENAAKHLSNEDFKRSILKNVSDEEKLWIQPKSYLWNEAFDLIDSFTDKHIKNQFTKKKIILVMDFLNYEKLSEDDEATFYLNLNNLLDNINQSFICMLAPALKLEHEIKWFEFITNQINNCHMLVVVFSPVMIKKLLCILSDEKIKNHESCETMNMDEPLKFMWKTIIKSHKPIIGVIYENELINTVSTFMPIWFLLPTNIKLMFAYLIEISKC